MPLLSARQRELKPEDALSQMIVQTLQNLRRESQGNFDELIQQMQTARFPINTQRIRTMSLSQLEALWTMVLGYKSRVEADQSPILNSAVRPALDPAITAIVPFSIRNTDALTEGPQDCFIGLQAAVYNAYTFYRTNPSGEPSHVLAIPFANQPAARPALTKRSNEQVIVRNHNLQATGDPIVRTLALDPATGNLVAGTVGPVLGLTPGAATFVDRPALEDFCDGRNLWAMEYDDTNNVLQIHKVNLTTGVETVVVVTNFEGLIEAAFFAFGDNAVLIGQESSTAQTRARFFTLADGAAVGPFDFAAATTATGPLQRIATATPTDLRGAHVGGPFRVGTQYRAFMTPNAGGTNREALRVVTFDPTPNPANVYTVTYEAIEGQTEGWPVGALAVSIGNVAYSQTRERVVMISNGAAPLDVTLFSLPWSRQLTALFPVTARLTGLLDVSQANDDRASMLAVVTSAFGTQLVRIAA